ncbi:MAG: thiamine pyrophosphate-dependent enzyme [Pseudomonadota bacterium]
MSAAARLDRRQAIARLLARRTDLLVATGLGSPTYDVAAAGDHERNFYLWGAMGGAAMTGLGLALARPSEPVLVVTGDGEMLMGMGSFATIAQSAPANLTVVVIDNELYGETGAQETHTATGADLAGIARACGIASADTIDDNAGLDRLAETLHTIAGGPRVAVLKVARTESAKVLVTRDGAHNKARFRLALGLPAD